jgi:hypothetical protein
MWHCIREDTGISISQRRQEKDLIVITPFGDAYFPHKHELYPKPPKQKQQQAAKKNKE